MIGYVGTIGKTAGEKLLDRYFFLFNLASMAVAAYLVSGAINSIFIEQISIMPTYSSCLRHPMRPIDAGIGIGGTRKREHAGSVGAKKVPSKFPGAFPRPHLTSQTINRLFESGVTFVFKQDGVEHLYVDCNIVEGRWCYFIDEDVVRAHDRLRKLLDGIRVQYEDKEKNLVPADLAVKLTDEVGEKYIEHAKDNTITLICTRPKDRKLAPSCDIEWGWTHLAQEGPVDQIWPGMGISRFRVVRPGIVPKELPFNRHLKKEGRFLGMDGTWSFDFENGILKTVSFRSTGDGVFSLEDAGDERLAKQFALYKKRLKHVEQNLKKSMGTPAIATDLLSKYKTDREKKHISTTLYSASWQKDKLIAKLELDFEGYPGFLTTNAPPAYSLHYNISVSFSGVGKKASIQGHRWYPGMAAQTFAGMEKGLLPNGLAEKGQWSKKEKIYGVEGSWSYVFDQGKLDCYSFNRWWQEPSDVNAENFSKGLKAARALIKEYKTKYGKPMSYYERNTSFKDPAKYHHWGYEVIEAKWERPKEKIKVSFEFNGGKQQYFLLLNVSVFNKDYPYF